MHETRLGAILVAILVLSAYLVPYAALSEVKAWYGSFLYWVLFALAAIAVVAWLTRSWGAGPADADVAAGSEARYRHEGRNGP
ncbi:hypothetical protein U7230_15315 [Carboxydochorda subterranea]|uniref:Uncharacterized protein n=1 Tax=Carboxydichorda subterranea TaxID=3109565 RepID=A0ABZ1BZB5_9FIRM|nr:hypothetical protein [Limnochorda sp. L945t]WRP17428.1 hypothetical protein U7230_15315 [Limnochorda sp. L945t]